ncbi:MAG: RidA family protein [Solirubrobacterales bacterium]
MKRTTVNPYDWSKPIGFSLGELIEGHERVLHVAGQVARAPDGEVQHVGDMAGQLRLVVDNVDAVLVEAGMSFANIVRLGVFTTDVDLLKEHRGILTERLQAVGISPPQTLLGVARLALPDMLVEIEATAAA